MVGKKGNTPLSPADRQAWEDVKSSVEPLEEHERLRQPAKEIAAAGDENSRKPPPPPKQKKKDAPDNLPKKTKAAPKPSPRPDLPDQIDRRSQRKIAKGQTPIDSTLDLHGQTQEQAYARLCRHIEAASAAGERCVLVITGKGGEKGEGVLRRNLPGWLGNQALGGLVTAISPAARSHGGGGAWYVRLKKQK